MKTIIAIRKEKPGQKSVVCKIDEHGCWICISHYKDENGYPYRKIGGKRKRLHRTSYEVYKGEIPQGMCVLHNCPGGDNSSCINPDHLWLGTKAQNNSDRAKKGRNNNVVGEKHPASKIAEYQAKEIKNMKRIDAAKKFGLHVSTIWRIQTGRSWKHLVFGSAL